MTDYPLRGGVSIHGLPVAGICHAGKRIGLAHDGIMLVPSGKNLLSYGAGTGDNWVTEIAPDGGLTVTLGKGFKAWGAITFETTLSYAGLEPGDAVVVSCDELADYVRISTRFMVGGELISEADYITPESHVVRTSIPDGTKRIQTQIFTTASVDADMTLHLHPQIEKGSERTCWEPPENLRGGAA